MTKTLVLAGMVAACSGCAGMPAAMQGFSQSMMQVASRPQPVQTQPVNCTTTYFRNQAYTTCR